MTGVWNCLRWICSCFRSCRAPDPCQCILCCDDSEVCCQIVEKRHIVGIFTRDSSVAYSWLVSELQSPYFSQQVKEVRPVYISNRGKDEFREQVSKCTFAILYHSKNRGRLNITDVTDALYDDELEYLCSVIGMANVIVVIDDLEVISYEDKCKILEQQPKVNNLATDLFLIGTRNVQSPYKKGFLENRQWMREIMSKDKKRPPRGDMESYILSNQDN